MRISFVLLLVLTACNGPVLSMRDATRTEASAGGIEFNVFHNGIRAEAHRTSRLFKPKAKTVFAAARQAILQSSGCQVDEGSWSGDVAVVKVNLNC
jgi:hypothetical protein